jgi:hypothetical protein
MEDVDENNQIPMGFDGAYIYLFDLEAETWMTIQVNECVREKVA